MGLFFSKEIPLKNALFQELNAATMLPVESHPGSAKICLNSFPSKNLDRKGEHSELTGYGEYDYCLKKPSKSDPCYRPQTPAIWHRLENGQPR